MYPRRPIAIYYEHPQWFRPLFAELERRGIAYEALHADAGFDPSQAWAGRYSLLLNRMSPSAWDRGGGGAVFFTQHLLRHVEAQGVEVINGSETYQLDVSKGAQIAFLQRLGLAAPRTRVVYGSEQLLAASADLVFPLLVKPNMGGNGAGIERMANRDELAEWVRVGGLRTGPDGVFLLQEYHPPQGRSVVRAETLDGRFLYAIRLHLGSSDGFSVCPADVGCTLDGRRLSANAREQGHENGARVEEFRPSPEVIAEIEAIARAGRMDLGGVEYLDSDRDGQRYYYDINALSNFIADPVEVLGFDPTSRLVDSLAGRLLAAAA